MNMHQDITEERRLRDATQIKLSLYSVSCGDLARPSLPPVFDHLQYAKMEQVIKKGGKGLGMRLVVISMGIRCLRTLTI